MEPSGRPYRLTATGAVGVAGSPKELVSVIVGKAVASGTVAVWNGADATGASTLIATLAMDVARPFSFGGCFMDKGVWLVITGASPDVTVVAR